MAYAFLTDGYRVIEFKQVTSKAELEELNNRAAEEAGPGFRWEVQNLKPEVPTKGRMMPKPVINLMPYDADARAGTSFEQGEDSINEEDSWATFVIDQRDPCHNCKILVFGDEHLRDLLVDFLNKLFRREEEKTADAANQAG